MKRVFGVINLLLVLFLVASPMLIVADANYSPAQTSVTYSDELLENPDFAVEPYVEIGSFSPEFDSEYASTGDAGSVSLIWNHTAGYELDFGMNYPPECEEYAKLSQLFPLEVNKSVLALKVSVSYDVQCTDDFATQEIMSNMWEVNIEITHVHMYEPYTLRTVSDLQNGDSGEIEIITTKVDTRYAFYDEVPLMYIVYVELTPTYPFMATVGEVTPWEDFSGSIIFTIDHMSVEALYEGSSLAPPIREPKYNTTEFTNTTSEIWGIESAGYSSIFQVRNTDEPYPRSEIELRTLSSNHGRMWNKSMLHLVDDSGYFNYITCASTGGKLATISGFTNDTKDCAFIQYYDSIGNQLWNSTEVLFDLDLPLYVDIDSAGNVFVFVLSIGEYSSSLQYLYSIMKLDSQGIRLWNYTVGVQYYSELVESGGTLLFPTGFECSGENLFIGIEDTVQKYDSNGDQLWSRDFPHILLCADPRGGCYTFSQEFEYETELVRWDTNGDTTWTKSLGLDYGSGWIEYPFLQKMTVSPNGPLFLVLGYERIYPCSVLMSIARGGQVLSQDTIFEGYETEYAYTSYRPYVTDMAVTGDGLVHIIASADFYTFYSGFEFSSPLFPIPGHILLTFELPGSTPINPISIAMGGIASVLIIGIAYDYFFRRTKVPEPPAEPSISDFEW